MDEITEANKIAEVNGPGLDPTAAPTEAPAGEATPEPTPAVLVNATMEDDSTEPIEKRGDASVSIVEDGANGTGKSAKITDRSADWHGAAIDVTSFAETDNDYEITLKSIFLCSTSTEVVKRDMMESRHLICQMTHGQNVKQK